MAVENVQKQKKENVKKLSALKEAGEFSLLFKKLKEAKLHLEHTFGMVKELERKQEEKLRLEDAEYIESLKNASSYLDEESVPEPQAVSEPEPEKEAEKPAEPKVEVKKESPEPQAPTQKAEPVTRTKQFAPEPGRPSFLSANQRPRTNLTPSRPPQGQQGQFRNQDGRPPYSQPRPFNNNRPAGAGGGTTRPFKVNFTPAPDITNKTQRSFDPKKDHGKQGDDKKTMSKRTLIRKGFVQDEYGEDRMGSKKMRSKKKTATSSEENKITKAVITSETLTVKSLSETIGVPAALIIKHLMNLGKMVTINSYVDFDNMALVAIELGVELEHKVDKTKEEILFDFHADDADSPEMLIERPPVVTIMGHVDHGKTSLLDALRETNVVGGEAGGITQHIGAYSVNLDGKKITFIDTPGHEAFTEMRSRGAKVTDIAVIVVAADDGIMPQTIEAIDHVKAAEVPIIIAVNKIDKHGADIEKIKQQLGQHGIVPEDWGGDSPVIGVSAKQKIGLDVLLKNILMLAELKELKANPDRRAKGTIIEAKLDKAKGPLATIIVQNGTLVLGDTVIAGVCYGKIRAMHDEKGRELTSAGPSTAVSVLGFQEVPNAGSKIQVVENEKLAKQVIQERIDKVKYEQEATTKNVSLDDIYSQISEGQIKTLNLIVKADTQGTAEALKASLQKLGNEEVRVRTIHGGAGAINKSDIMLADASKAVIIGFNVRPDNEAKIEAERDGVDIRLYNIIYDAINDVTDAVKGMLAPKFREQILGHAEVRTIFNITGAGIIAGCFIKDGKLTNSAKLRVVRDNIVVYDGEVDKLKRFKDDVKEVASGYECGVSIVNYSDIKELDILEAYEQIQINN